MASVLADVSEAGSASDVVNRAAGYASIHGEGSQVWGGSWDTRYWSTGLSSDVVSAVASKSASTTDAATASELISALASKLATIVNAAAAADAVVVISLFTASHFELASGADVALGVKAGSSSVAETVLASESLSGAKAGLANLAESSPAANTQSGIVAASSSSAEAITSSDAISGVKVGGAASQETGSAVDTSSGTKFVYIVSIESSVALEMVSGAATAFAGRFESLPASESISAFASNAASISTVSFAVDASLGDRICNALIEGILSAVDVHEAAKTGFSFVIERCLSDSLDVGSVAKLAEQFELAIPGTNPIGAAIKYDAVFSFATPSDYMHAKHYGPAPADRSAPPNRDLFVNPERRWPLVTPGVVVDVVVTQE